MLANAPVIGVVLDAISGFGSSPAWVFNDAFLGSSDWVSQAYDTVTGSETWAAGPAISLDSSGWPTQLATYNNGDPIQQRVGTLMFREIDGQYPAGAYTVQWTGTGTLNFGFDARQTQTWTSNGTHYALLQVTPSAAGIYLEIAADNVADPIRNIHVWMPDALGQAQTGQVWAPGDNFSPFTPEFLAELQPFNTLRFMDWMNTNSSSVVNWSDVRPLSYARQAGGANGVSYEYIIELANELNENIWINLPYRSSSDFNVQMATMFENELKPNLEVYLEWSNEVWNSAFGFDTYSWITSQLALPQNAGVDRDLFIAEQISNDFGIWSQVYGSQADRLVRVVAWQAVDTFNSDIILSDLHGQFDAVSMAAYVTITPTSAVAANWGASTTGDDVLNAAFTELPSIIADAESYDALAQKYSAQLGRHILFVAYEGGEQFTASGFTVNYQQALYDAQVNPRIYSLYQQLITGFAAAGGTLFMHYSNISQNSKFGSFGALQYQGEPISDAPKYQALLDAANGVWNTSGVGPTVIGVYVSGSAWNSAYEDLLDQSGLGAVGLNGAVELGYSLPSGTSQYKPLPWSNLDTLRIAFDENVEITSAALKLLGALAEPSIASFRYDSVHYVATWMFTSPIGANANLIVLDNTKVTDAAGTKLDGLWVAQSSKFADQGGTGSGNGTSGTDFDFGFYTLTGDVQGIGTVLSFAAIQVRNALGASMTSSAYNYRADVTGQGGILSSSFITVRTALGESINSLTIPSAPANAHFAAGVSPPEADAGPTIAIASASQPMIFDVVSTAVTTADVSGAVLPTVEVATPASENPRSTSEIRALALVFERLDDGPRASPTIQPTNASSAATVRSTGESWGERNALPWNSPAPAVGIPSLTARVHGSLADAELPPSKWLWLKAESA